MGTRIYGGFSLTGGGANSLDAIDGAGLEAGDAAIIFTDTRTRFYKLDPTHGGIESSPNVITPDSSPGTKRWVLVTDPEIMSEVDEDIIPDLDITRSLGSPTKQWKDVYVGPGSLYVNGQKVLEEDSGTIVVSADSDQNLQFKSVGSGDIELLPAGTGVIQMKGNFSVLGGKNIMSSDGNAISFSDGIDMNGNKITELPEPTAGTDAATRNYVTTYSSNASNLSSGTIPTSVLPPIAMTTVKVALSEVAMLALTTEEGDVIVRSDENKTYMRNNGSSGTMTDFTELATPTDSVLSVNGATGTVILNQDQVGDGTTYVRTHNDLSDTLKTKLDGIQAGATDDQTASEILTALKTVDGSGSGLDADLLDGKNSDVNNTADTIVLRDAEGDVNGRYFTMSAPVGARNSDEEFISVSGGTLYRNTTVGLKTSLGLENVENGAEINPTSSEIKTSYESNANTNAFTDALLSKVNGIEAGADVNPTNSEIKTAYEANANTNAFTDALLAKINAIEANATADMTAAQILAALLTVDGTGSGLDADKLDGLSPTVNATANTIVSRDGSGNITVNIMNGTATQARYA
jgi:hypothetical protein